MYSRFYKRQLLLVVSRRKKLEEDTERIINDWGSFLNRNLLTYLRKDGVKMIIKSIMTDEDRKALEYMLSLEYAMPYQLLKTKIIEGKLFI